MKSESWKTRVIEARVAHEKAIEGSGFNTISSMVVKGECYRVRLQNSDFGPTTL